VAVVALRAGADAAADAHPVGVRVAFALHGAVVHRVVGVDVPPEQLGVVALERVSRTLREESM